MQPVNVKLIPSWNELHPDLQVAGAQHRLRRPLRRLAAVGPERAALPHGQGQAGRRTSWAALYDPKYKGQITIPNNPIQIADAAFYLMQSQPDLGITDPYELNKKQFDATVTLLKQQRPLVKKLLELRAVGRDRPVQERRRRRSAPSWPYQTQHAPGGQGAGQGADPLRGRDRLGGHLDALAEGEAPELRLPVDEVGLARRRSRPSRRSSSARRPANTKACPIMDQIEPGLVRAVPRRRAGVVLRQRSSSGRRRSPTAATARTTAWTTTPGRKPGPRSRARCSMAAG